MKRTGKMRAGARMLAALLCCALLLTGVAPQSVYAGQSTEASSVRGNQKGDAFATNNQKEEAFRFLLKDGALIVESVPSSGGYAYVWVKIKGGGEAIFPVSAPEAVALPARDGTYYAEIYLGKERYGTYDGVIWGKTLGILIENKTASFAISPVYEDNWKRYEKESVSDTARGYYTQPSYWVESDAPEIKKLAKEIVSAGDSDFEKIKKVHDWVADNIWYDWDSLRSGKTPEVDALRLLEEKRTVCSGYANLSAALLRALGVPTKVRSGYALGVGSDGAWTDKTVSGSESNHAWNEAYADGRWIIFDATWDSDNKYENGKFSRGTGLSGRKYFDPTLEFFSLDHKILPEDEYFRWEREQAFEKALSVSKESLSLKKGKTKQLAVKTSKKYINLKDAKITYSSSNQKVASVSAGGKIKAKKAGNAVITTKVKLEGVTLKFRTSVTVKK